MNKFLKTLITIGMAALLTFPAAAYERVALSLNGSDTKLDARLIGSTTYVDIDEISCILSEATGATPEIAADAGENYISARGRFIGGSENLGLDGKLFVPVRSVARIFNADVKWQDQPRAVGLTVSENPGISSGDDFYIQDEVEWLSRIIYAEAGAEPFNGKVLVGNVVLNRMRSDEFPDTIYDVIFDRKFGVQFSPVANGSIWNDPDSDSVIAAKLCLDGYSLSTEAIYFLNPDIATNFWIPQNRKFLLKVGGHEFYS